MKCEKGFTLVEAMIAMLIASGIAMAVATVANLSAKAERNATMGAEHIELLGLIRQIISQPGSCTANLKDLPIDLAKFTPTPIDVAMTVKDVTNPLVFSKGQSIIKDGKFGKIQVNAITMRAYAQLTASVWLIKVGIVGEKTGSFLGGKDLVGEISAQVQVDEIAGKVVKCLGDQDLSLALTEENIQLNDRICQVASNGSAVYDPKTKTCVVNTDCYAGGKDSAVCPAGMRVSGCDAEGIIDPSTNVMSRPLTSGRIVSGGPPAFACAIDSALNGATCEYAMDVNAGGAKCKACCRALVMTSGG